MAFEHPALLPDDAPFDDPDNPEWTEADFARAKTVDELPEEEHEAILAAFPNTRRLGRPRQARTKLGVYLRLDPEVVEHFKAGGAGWQTRINAALQAVVRQARD